MGIAVAGTARRTSSAPGLAVQTDIVAGWRKSLNSTAARLPARNDRKLFQVIEPE